MTEGVVFDRGYRPHDGPRLGRRGARLALYRDGLRRVLGLRRKTRKKVLPFVLVGVAVVPALFFVAVGVVVGEFAEDVALFGHPQYFNLQGAMALIFVALAAGELLIPDRVSGTLQIYASRPLTTIDYLMARGLSLATVVVGFLWLPHIVLLLGRAWVSSRGFAGYLADEYTVLGTTFVAALVYLAAYAPLAFAVAALAKRPALAAGAYLGIMTISAPIAESLVDAGNSSLGLFALVENPGHVKDSIMGASTAAWIPERAGFSPLVSLAVILTIAFACWVTVLFRQRRAL